MKLLPFCLFLLHLAPEITSLFAGGGLDLNIFKCMWKKNYGCPHDDVRFILYTPRAKRGKLISVHKPETFWKAGFVPQHETAIIIHGFNGTQTSKHIQYLTNAYLSREYNVIAVDWETLTKYPCYLSSLSNTKLVSQCTAQLYSYLTYIGSRIQSISCVGHSLGAHICGMMSNHLSKRQHKIIGLDPAKPLVENHASVAFRLTRDDAAHVQIIHTNAGFLGQSMLTGSIDFCINGGRVQPYCKGNAIRRARCSHFLSVCYLANSIYHHKKALGVPCPNGCTMNNRLPFHSPKDNDIDVFHNKLKYFQIGQDTPDNARGAYCIRVEHAEHCPFH
ncbi:unnamed protein product [Diamesa hyperborea]